MTLPTAAPDWVPVDRRWLGLDKRTLKPAFFVLAVVIVFVGVVPAINNAISWTNQTTAGDVINMGDDIKVKVLLIDDQGRIKLSRKAAMLELGESDPDPVGAPAGCPSRRRRIGVDGVHPRCRV